jgi:hypothetical protein
MYIETFLAITILFELILVVSIYIFIFQLDKKLEIALIHQRQANSEIYRDHNRLEEEVIDLKEKICLSNGGPCC